MGPDKFRVTRRGRYGPYAIPPAVERGVLRFHIFQDRF
jgi:hypothetical protein